MQSLLTIKYRNAIFILVILMYLAGTIGLLIPYTQPYFKLASPLNLWVSLILLISFHEDLNKTFIFTAIFIFLTGFLVEVAGVHTGIIFGKYWYGHTLGTQLFDVPLVIGANWLLLVYCSSISVKMLFSNIKHKSFFTSIFIQSTIAAMLMVGLDYLIEPVAISLDFWHWQFDKIPTQNYQAWFLLSFILIYFFLNAKFSKTNPLALLVLFLQFLFFICITIFHHFV